ncbi:MAG: carbohydrate deacetylase [Candidatus Acidiferrales bacterium]
MTAIRLIVNADDFGMTRGITDGICTAHERGFLTSASLMPNMPAAEYAVARLANIHTLAVGVHLNICQGRPILRPCEVRSLVDSHGFFHAPRAMARKLWRWQISGREIEAEFREQIRWLKYRGIAPTHADSHHHMHIYPAALKPFARALAAEGIHRARAPRCNQWPPTGHIGGPHAGGIVRKLFVQGYRAAVQFAVLGEIQSPDGRVAFAARHRANGVTIEFRWKSMLENLPPGTFEFACHPGLSGQDSLGGDALVSQRERELRCLMDPELRKIIDRREIQLITYEELSAPGITHRAPSEAVRA